MPDDISSQLIIDLIGDMINGVDANSKRESDKLCSDITLLRGELNDTRKDMILMREEMNTLRVDMSNMRGKLEKEMVTCDQDQQHEIELIKQEAKITGDRKAQLYAGVITALGLLAAIAGKILGII